MQQGPWQKYQGQTAPTAPIAPPAAPGGVIYGRPKRPDPLELERLRLSQEANDRAANADARAARTEDRTIRKTDLDIAKTTRELEREAQGGGGTEGERTAAFLTTRLEGALQTMNGVTNRNPDAASPEWDAKIAGFFNETAANYLTSSDRQQVEAAQLDALDAALTLGTGAAYTKEQLEGYRKSYFPQLGDSAGTIESKKQNFARLLQAARVKSGSAVGAVDRALAAANAAQGDVGPQVQSLSISNVADLASGLSGGRYDINEDATLSYNGETVPVSDTVANSDEFRERYRAKFGKYPPVVASVTGGDGGGDPPPPPTDGQRDTTFGAVDAAVRGAADVLTLGTADEIAAAGQTIFGGGTMADNLQRERGIDATDQRVNPWARGAGQVAGALALPIGRTAATPGQFARTGGIVGAGYGAGSAEGGIVDRVGGAAQGGAAGALGGYAIGRGLQALGGARNALAGRNTPAAPQQAERNALLQAGQRQDVPIMPADVGGPMIRSLTAGAAQGPVSAMPVVAAARRSTDALQGAVGRQVDSLGGALADDAAGESVRQAGQRYVGNETARIGRMYDRAKDLAKDVTIVPQRAMAAIDRRVTELSELGETNAPLITALTKLKSDIQGGVSVNGLRNARTSLSQGVYDGKLRSSQEKQIYRDVLEEISGDISQGLADEGLQNAASVFRRADTLWKARIEQIDEVLEPIIGAGKSGEDILNSLNGMTKGSRGGVARLNRLMKEIPEPEADRIRATLIDKLGRARSGQQDDVGSAFSPETFLTRWNDMSPRGKAIMFGGGELRRNLDDIAKLSAGMRESGRFRNYSNTAGGISAQIMLSGGAGLVGGFPGLALASATQFIGGRALTSPVLTRWLARAPKTGNVQAQRSHIERLSTIANREPAIRNEVIQLQQRLLESITQQPRLAAEEPNQSR